MNKFQYKIVALRNSKFKKLIKNFDDLTEGLNNYGDNGWELIDIKYKHLRRFSKNLVWSNYFSCYEVLIYDIFELIPNENQKQALTKLHDKKNNLEKGSPGFLPTHQRFLCAF